METTHGLMAVQEIQGLDGLFTFPERALQRIWARREFDDATARTTGGTDLRVHYPGKWNRLGGPDFRQARLQLAGREITGDVELHLHADDWEAHGHARDPAYGAVVLHAVLFPPEKRIESRRPDGALLPLLVLLPLLRRGLEEYAEEEAVENLAQRPGVAGLEELIALPPSEQASRLHAYAERRWMLKVHHAAVRIARLGWTEACHHTALEILGYRFNREPMLRVAGRFPLVRWASPEFSLSAVLETQAGRWVMQGVRPANRPAERLRQYHAWVTTKPGWPEALEAVGPRLGSRRADEAGPRREQAHWRRELADATGAGAVGGGRFENLVCDGFLPLLSARTGWEGFGLWSECPAGDGPAFLSGLGRALAGDGAFLRPRTQGFIQGILGWLLESERRSRL